MKLKKYHNNIKFKKLKYIKIEKNTQLNSIEFQFKLKLLKYKFKMVKKIKITTIYKRFAEFSE